MFTVIYSFKIKPNHDTSFIAAWKEMTTLIMNYEGGLGSRLHKQSESHYIAYAQWPDKETWKNAGDNLPEKAHAVRDSLRISCINMETLYELDVLEDLLIHT